MSGHDFLVAMGAFADAYRRRYEEPSPIEYLAPDWAIQPMLDSLDADGRPGTREELDRWASEFLGYACRIVTYDENLSPRVRH